MVQPDTRLLLLVIVSGSGLTDSVFGEAGDSSRTYFWYANGEPVNL